MKRSNLDLLNGSIVDKLLLFALPLAVTGILQQLFNAADIAVVGRFVGKEAMAAVGSNSPLVGLFVNGFLGISLGLNVVISQFTGQKDEDNIARCVHTAIPLALLGGVCVSCIGEIAAPLMLHLLRVPADVFPMALTYLRLYLLGLPVIFLYNFESAIFRSQGDTRTPLACLMISGVANVGMNLFFVCVVGMASGGVALATVLSNLFSSLLLFTLLCRRTDAIRLRVQNLRIDPGVLRPIIRIGVPAGLQSMLFSISNICLQSAINQLGTDIMAASSASFNIEIFAYYIVNAFGQACSTFIGQNYGARNLPRCRKITRIALAMSLVFCTVISAFLLIFAHQLLGLFNTDPAIIAAGTMRMRFILLAEPISAVMEIMSGVLRGFGNSLTPAVLTFIGVCGIRITWVYTVFRIFPTFFGLMITYPLSWFLTAASLTVAYLLFIRKLQHSMN